MTSKIEKRIFIRGAGFRNKGAEAMLLTIQNELQKRIPNIVFSATALPEESDDFKEHNIEPIIRRHISFLNKLTFVFKTLFGNPDIFFKSFKSMNTAIILEEISHSDVVLDASGFAYGDQFSTGSSKRTLEILKYCKKHKKPYIFMPQSWGPFENKKTADVVSEICKLASVIYPRDNFSRKSLNQLGKFNSIEQNVCVDIAFKFKPEDNEFGFNTLKKCGLDAKSRKIIGIIPNIQIYKRTTGTGKDNKYVEFLSSLIEHVIQKFNVNILLIAHAQDVSDKNNQTDFYLCSLIKENLSNVQNCTILPGTYSSKQLKSIINNLDFVISSRYHGLIAALSCGIPVLAIGWAKKYRELLSIFGLERYELDNNSLNVQDADNLLNDAWQDKNKNKQLIIDRLNIINHSIDTLFDNITKIITKE